MVWARSESKGNPGKYYPPGQGGRTESEREVGRTVAIDDIVEWDMAKSKRDLESA